MIGTGDRFNKFDGFAFRYQERHCPMCGKPILTKFYNEKERAWYFKHQRLVKAAELEPKGSRKKSYYCEAKAVG